ncbi:MAG: zinc finger Ran-binding domain-containing protein [Actinomycetota bacterium]
MAETKRCPNCGARNPASAEWCSLCLERFDVPVAVDEGQAEPSVPPSMADPEIAAELKAIGAEEPKPVAQAAVGVERGAFKVSEEGIRWQCSVCDHMNSLQALHCEVCGTPFAAAVKPKEQRPPRDPGTVAMISLFFPGAGHAYLGMWPQAITRGVIQFWVLIVVLFGLVWDVPGSALLAGSFGLVAFALWLIAAHDAFREARDEANQVLLKGRMFLWLTLGLLGFLFTMLVVSGLSARG